LRSLDHSLVEQWASQAKAPPKWKISLDLSTFIDEANSMKGKSLDRIDRDAELLNNGQSVRHKTFTAGLFDGRLHAIGHRDVEPALSCGNSGGKSSRPPADYKHVRCLPHPCSSMNQVRRPTQVRALNVDRSLG
jgi:hypothetical protein